MPKYIIEVDVPTELPLEALKEMEMACKEIAEKYMKNLVHVTWRPVVEQRRRREIELLQI